MRTKYDMRTHVIISTIAVLFALFFNLWVIPSIITSGIKSVSDKCGYTYPVEKVWEGNWFCGKKD